MPDGEAQCRAPVLAPPTRDYTGKTGLPPPERKLSEQANRSNSHPTDLSRRASGLPVAGYRCCLSRQVGHPASSQGGSLDSSGEHRAREFPEAHQCSTCALGLHRVLFLSTRVFVCLRGQSELVP